jgi:group I intron endonuclease
MMAYKFNPEWRRAGVYEIVCAATNKRYIGSTLNLTNRFRQHCYHLQRSAHFNIHLQRIFNRDGADGLTFLIREFVEDPANLRGIEQAHIDAFKTSELLNLLPLVGAIASLSEESRERAAIAKKKHSPQDMAKMRKAWAEGTPIFDICQSSGTTKRTVRNILYGRGVYAEAGYTPPERKRGPSKLKGRPGRAMTAEQRRVRSGRKWSAPEREKRMGAPIPESITEARRERIRILHARSRAKFTPEERAERAERTKQATAQRIRLRMETDPVYAERKREISRRSAAKNRETSRKWVARNPEKVRATQRRTKLRPEYIEAAKQHRLEHADEARERSRLWYWAHKNLKSDQS